MGWAWARRCTRKKRGDPLADPWLGRRVRPQGGRDGYAGYKVLIYPHWASRGEQDHWGFGGKASRPSRPTRRSWAPWSPEQEWPRGCPRTAPRAAWRGKRFWLPVPASAPMGPELAAIVGPVVAPLVAMAAARRGRPLGSSTAAASGNAWHSRDGRAERGAPRQGACKRAWGRRKAPKRPARRGERAARAGQASPGAGAVLTAVAPAGPFRAQARMRPPCHGHGGAAAALARRAGDRAAQI